MITRLFVTTRIEQILFACSSKVVSRQNDLTLFSFMLLYELLDLYVPYMAYTSVDMKSESVAVMEQNGTVLEIIVE